MQLVLRTYNLKLKHTFTTSRQSYNTKPTLIVELIDGKFTGYGEASENPYYQKTINNMVNDLLSCKDIIESTIDVSPEEFWNKMYPYLKDDLFALCALDLAYNDLYARRKSKKLYEIWNYNIDNNPVTNYTIGIDTIENMVSKMKETPWPIYKIKLGTSEDIKIIRELRKHSTSTFRIDANCAWAINETILNSIELKKLGVEFIEQPLPADNWPGSKELFLKSKLPIIADESCQIETDIARCYNHFHGVNIKLTKCGGLTPARRMLKEAKKIGMKTMVGCMTESSVGISSIAHLLPELNYVDMDGAMLLEKDIAEGIKINYGKIYYSKINGNGVKLLKDKLKTIENEK